MKTPCINKPGLKTLFLLSVGSLSVGCAPDRTTTDFHNERVNEELAAIQQVQGVYRGIVYSKKDNSPLGSVTLQLQQDTTLGQSSDGLATVTNATLKGSVKFDNESLPVLNFSQGAYDKTTNTFKVSQTVSAVAVASANSSSAPGSGSVIDIGGSFANNQMTGTIENEQYPDSGGTFTLVKDGPTPTVQGLDRWQEMCGQMGKLMSSYYADFKYSYGSDPYASDQFVKISDSEHAQLDLMAPTKDEQLQLVDMLSKTRVIGATLRFSSGTQVYFPAVLWNTEAGSLDGTGVITADSQSVSAILQCKLGGSDPAQTGWTCSYYSGLAGWVFQDIYFDSKSNLPGSGSSPAAAPSSSAAVGSH